MRCIAFILATAASITPALPQAQSTMPCSSFPELMAMAAQLYPWVSQGRQRSEFVAHQLELCASLQTIASVPNGGLQVVLPRR
jgi:hypothetical protein